VCSKLFNQNPKVRPQPMLHHISRCVTQIRFYRCCSYVTVRISVHKTFTDPSPDRVLWLNERPSRGSSFCFAFSGHIRADSDAKCHDLYERFHLKWKWRFADKAKKYIKAKIQSKRPSRKYQRSLLRYLLSSIHWSCHITSKFATSSRTESNFLRQSSGTNPCK
jgi:8-oxo-dGTP pyrophosphatase MutT (NUDIX family)